MKKILLVFLSSMLATGSVCAQSDISKKIGETKAFINDRYFNEWASIKNDAKETFHCSPQAIPIKLRRAISHLEYLYTQVLKERTFKNDAEKAKFVRVRDYYRRIDHALGRSGCARRHGVFFRGQYLSLQDKIKVENATESQRDTYSFGGALIGGGYEHHNGRFSIRYGADIGYFRGKVTNSNLNYNENSAVLRTLNLTFDVGYKFTEYLTGYFGIPMFYRSLSTNDSGTLKATAESSYFIGPEVSLQYAFYKTYSVFARAAYLQSNPAVGLGVAFHMP